MIDIYELLNDDDAYNEADARLRAGIAALLRREAALLYVPLDETSEQFQDALREVATTLLGPRPE